MTKTDGLTISLISPLPLAGCQFQSEVRQDRLEYFLAWLRSREYVVKDREGSSDTVADRLQDASSR
jgi:hypothetical protein